jgi:hypothetical protein
MRCPHAEWNPDLFDGGSRWKVIPLDQKQHVVSLIAALLIEVANEVPMETTQREGSDDKDHT